MKHVHTRVVNSNHKVIKRPYTPSQAPTHQSHHCPKVPSSQAPSRPVVVGRIGRDGGACPTECTHWTSWRPKGVGGSGRIWGFFIRECCFYCRGWFWRVELLMIDLFFLYSGIMWSSLLLRVLLSSSSCVHSERVHGSVVRLRAALGRGISAVESPGMRWNFHCVRTNRFFLVIYA